MGRPTDAIRYTRNVAGDRIAWVRSGPARSRRPTIVRVAHWLTHVEHEATSPVWGPWLQAFERLAPLLRYDEQGYGASAGGPSAPRTLDDCLDDLHAAVVANGESPVTLFGTSGAAPIALAYAARHPSQVAHLVLLGGYACGLDGREASAEAREWADTQIRMVELGWGRGAAAVQQFFSAVMLPDATPAEQRELSRLQVLSCGAAQAARFLRTRRALDVRDRAPQVACPTLLFHAESDQVIPPSWGRDLAAAIPGARMVTLPARNHVPTPSDKAFALLFEHLAAFLDEAGAVPVLTPRERELARVVAQGLDNAQIAAHLGVAGKTVRNALSVLYAKLEVEGRPQAVARTRDLGLDR